MNPQGLPKEPFALRAARWAARLFPRGRSALVRQTAHWLGYHQPFVAQVKNLRLVIDLHDRVARTLYLYGNFERDVTQLLDALLKPGQMVFDVGANFGYFSLLTAGKVGAAGRVYAFEPDPRNFQRLKMNLALNHVTNIHPVPQALFDRAGTLTLHVSSDTEDNLGSSSLVDAAHGRKVVEVDAGTLDDFISKQSLSRVDVVKMDIEGAEFGAIHGATESLKTKIIGGLLIELHRDIIGAAKLAALVRMLQDLGYTPWFVHGRNPRARQVKEMVDAYDPEHQFTQPNPHFLFTAQSL